MKCSLGTSDFLEEISTLSPSIVSLYFFAVIIEKAFPISPCYSLELCIQMGISFLFSVALHFFFHSIDVCKAFSDNHFAFFHFFFLGTVLITASCTMLQTFVHSSSGTLSGLFPWIYLSLPLNSQMGFDLGNTWMALWFSLLSSISVWIWQ